MAHEARVVRDERDGREVAAVVRPLRAGGWEVVARIDGPADDAALGKARVMAAALDGAMTFTVDDWRKGEGDGGFERLGAASRATHVATLEASGSGCALTVRPAGHGGDPDDRCVSISVERNAGALWIGVGPAGADALASVLVGPKGALLQPSTGDLGLLVLSAAANGRFLNRVEQVRCADDTRAREAIGVDARPEAAPGWRAT